MKWSEISIQTTNEAVEPISNILHEAGASGVVIEDPVELIREREDQFGEIYELNPQDYPEEGIVIVKAYLPVNSFLAETAEGIEESIKNLSSYGIDIGRNEVKITEVHEEDWATAWKQYYHPVKISEKFTIVPTWEQYEPVSTDELIIELDPGMAFGTGTHPTTVMCLQALERYVHPGDYVVDVGTGSGVLSIGAAMLGAERVTALDLDEVAVEAAKENIRLNKVEEKVTVLHNNLLDGITEQADVVVANILAEVILSFTGDVAKKVKTGGYFISSGIIGQKKEQVKEAVQAVGFEVEETVLMEDWVAIIARKK
ncbi:50S ribosomal protein L11 methyltransferase [Bacillus badius]|uniref:Ribosomal protein L11 methyltransferase n=1 Tax=Bacillus badius TaxID=1455 RepID=A0ABR5AY30_BACBA|nr:50S ribosomal protein L11 methyltransferase [Bacillus badius]KIL75364.1 Ribosomal protein L11 methyltransferase [Bacillus badius]KIL79649.1 Ribosomal protein L11 methyltransferase [Bacillus badius]KZN98783.1 ribosomal protein L11 methyltransferase [Bacillus badius]KZR57883.1 ribosomal protein L11 methyltransferase [Bacillus badius]MED0666747.1 50S ribosomal protein L11 methyltransferase [Bacillus badius]